MKTKVFIVKRYGQGVKSGDPYVIQPHMRRDVIGLNEWSKKNNDPASPYNRKKYKEDLKS